MLDWIRREERSCASKSEEKNCGEEGWNSHEVILAVGFGGVELNLGKNAFDHRAVDIREPVIPASKAVRELFMVEPKQV